MSRISNTEFINQHKGYSAPRMVASKVLITPIINLHEGKAKIIGQFGSISTRSSSKKPYLNILESYIKDDSGQIRAIWFNRESLKYTNKDKAYIFFGNIRLHQGELTLVSPEFTTVSDYKKWEEKFNREVEG